MIGPKGLYIMTDIDCGVIGHDVVLSGEYLYWLMQMETDLI